MEFLDSEWISALHRSVEAVDIGEASLVIQQVVDEPDGREVGYHLQLTDGRVMVREGEHPAPTVVMRQSRSTAEAIRRGELNALTAFQQGRIDVSGEVQALIEARPALEAIDAAAAKLG